MIFFGAIFGGIGLIAAHLLLRHLDSYYLILIPAIALGILLGLGLNFGAKIGRCSRFSVLTFVFVLFFSLLVYAKLLFVNNYHDTYAKDATLGEELLLLTVDSWNTLDAVPYLSDYVAPLTDRQAKDAVANLPVLSSLVAPAEQAPDASKPTEQAAPATASPDEATLSPDTSAPSESPSPREHIGRQALDFFIAFPQRAVVEEPVLIGTLFHWSFFEPVRPSLERPGITKWQGDAADGRLMFDERAVKPWMAWTAEWLLIWLIAVLMTRSGTNKAYDSFQRRLEKKGGGKTQGGLQMKSAAAVTREEEKSQATSKKEKTPKEKKEKSGGFSLFGGKKKAKSTEETDQPVGGDEESKHAEKKKGGGFFGLKKKKTEEIDNASAAPSDSEELTFSEEALPLQEQSYAMILHQYDPQRQEDLVRLLQQVGQVSEESARKLLKTPSLVKRDVNTQQANIAIQKFQQVQAQVKLITMDQLTQLQSKQRPTPPPMPTEKPAKAPAPQPQKASAPPMSPSSEQPGEKYALVLRKFDQAQRKQVVELLASLSGTPVAQLQQSLKTPALVLRDASRDEVMMIAQQFQKIQAEVKMLTMAELQKLTNKSG